MATWLHKDGEKELVDATYVPSMLNTGWTADPEGETLSEEEGSEASNDDIREAAKAAGIEKWDTKRISTLRSELDYDAED